jgi:hypothetical protein
MSKEVRILGIHISERVKNANRVQETLTKYGCSIKTRLGMHDVADDYCSPCGLMLLELVGDVDECTKLEKELHTIENLDVQKMVFIC